MADMSLTRNSVDEAVDEGIVDGVKAQLFERCKPSKRFGSDHKMIKIVFQFSFHGRIMVCY